MAKQYANKYWEEEQGETIEFGNSFMRCYDKAGKLQFGIKYRNRDGEYVYQVKFVLDRKELFSSDEAPSYLRQLITDWEEMMEYGEDDD